MDWDALAPLLDQLAEACRMDDLPRIRALMASAPTGYTPAGEIVDPTWADPAAEAGRDRIAARRERPPVTLHALPAAAQGGASGWIGSAGSYRARAGYVRRRPPASVAACRCR